MAVGAIINQYFNVEIRGLWMNYGNDNNGSHPDRIRYTGRTGGHTDLTGGTMDFQYHFLREPDTKFSPYLVAALGGVNTSYRTDQSSVFTDRAFLFQLGLGTTYAIADYLSLRADIRYQLQDNRRHKAYNNNDPLNDLVVNVGFVFPLGALR